MSPQKLSGKDYSKCQENDIARWLNGKVQSNSGGTRFGGGDVHTNSFFIEAKTPTTSKNSFSIKKEWIDKIKQQAYEQNKLYNALAFRFDPDEDDYFVIDKYAMKYLVQSIESEEV